MSRGPIIAFSKEDRALLSAKLQAYVSEELDHEIGGLEAGFLLDWIARELGPAFYDQGVADAKTLMDKRLEEMTEALHALMKG